MIRNYNEFCTELFKVGFSGAIGGKDEGVFSLLRYGWGAEDESALYWHSNDPDTDPWEWRVRVLEERNDIAYAKVFFGKAGYITREWYPFFLAARRQGDFAHAYEDGLYSHIAKRIYDVLREKGALSVHELKAMTNLVGEKSRFEKALRDLQMGLFITMCGREQKRSKTGEYYGWASTKFCTVEDFWPPDVLEQANEIPSEQAVQTIAARVVHYNPNAESKKLRKFILGQ